MGAIDWNQKVEIQEKAVKEILTSNVLSISPDTPILEAVSLMRTNKISCLVVQENKKAVGIFTERDLVRMTHLDTYLKHDQIGQVMNQPVITADIDCDIYKAYDLFRQYSIRHLVLVDSDEEVAGVITQSDIMRNLPMGFFVEPRTMSKVMVKDVVTVKKESLVKDALSKMMEHSISCLVVEEDNYPVGILTGRDIVRLLDNQIEIKNLRIESVMSCPVLTISSDKPLYEASGIMNNRKVRRLVVVHESGRISGLITQSDIIRVLEERYSESLENIINRLKEDILSNVSHELKTPVTIIKSALQLAKDEEFKDEQERLFSMALKAVNRLNGVVEDLVTAADRHHAALYKPQFTGLDLVEIIPSFVTKMYEKAVERNVVIETALPKDLPRVEGNQLAIKRVLKTIVGNAIKFSKEGGGVVLITAKKEDSFVKVSISDEGIGIPSDKLDNIFDVLFQVDASTTRKYEGTGMGLAVAKSIIDSHEGRIWAESNNGNGTTVHFTLPLAKEE
jgi:signal transduction histidine kinase